MTDPTFEAQVLAFEQCWQRGPAPEICQFLPPAGSPEDRLRLLIELVCVDLEYRWRNRGPDRFDSQPPTIESYFESFPEVARERTTKAELIGEEYRVRQRWGDAPPAAEFVARFPELHDVLPAILQEIDRELHAEGSAPLPVVAPHTGSDRKARVDELPDARAPLQYQDYLLQELIGAGGMGKVYRALQRSLDRMVAVKFLRKSFLRNLPAVERFIGEARTVARLDHPGIVVVHGLGRTPQGGYFIAMNRVEGVDLSRRLERERPPIATAVEWMIAVCDAIHHAHTKGVVHCDLKPANVLVNTAGRVYVTDFGLARSLSGETAAVTELEGTAAFMAPEQVSDFWGPIGPQTDIYGLGALLFTLLTGRPPWRERRLPDILANVLSATPVVAASELATEVPAELSAICARCMLKAPDERYSSVREVREVLERWRG